MPPRRATAANEPFAKLVALGRAMRHLLPVGNGRIVIAYNFYGWTGGHDDPAAAKRSDAGLAAILGEAQAQGDECSLIMGDFNAELDDLASVEEAMTAGWTDLGACPRC